METRAHYAAVGAFVLAMVFLAFAAVLWLARGALNAEVARYDIYFQGPVTGLRIGAEVDYNGVPVGKVVDVRIDPRNVGLIRVRVEINDDVPIKVDARASVESNILSGVSYVLIDGGTQAAPLLRPQGDEEYAVIRAHRSRLASVTARAPELLEKLNDTADRLNHLLGDKNQKALAATLDNLQQFSHGLAERNRDIADLTHNADAAARGLVKFVDNVNRSYSGPNGLGQKAGTALADFDRLAKNLNNTNEQLQATLQEVRPGLRNFSQQTLGDLQGLVADARQLVSGLSRVSDQIENDPSRVLFGDRRQGYTPQ
ncbi:MAG TPA: MlaD family protein [Stellaceae bacterium]|nr:MlaD family protein [Stellaceae bacterium]